MALKGEDLPEGWQSVRGVNRGDLTGGDMVPGGLKSLHWRTPRLGKYHAVATTRMAMLMV